MTADAAIRVEGLVKSFKDLEVLRGVDFEVDRGSIFALLGSNGAGKTTVVRILATLLRADEGTATVHGFDVADRAGDVRESISLTGQFAAVDDLLSGRENLVLIARLRHQKDPARIAADLLGRFALTEAAERFPAEHSAWRRGVDVARGGGETYADAAVRGSACLREHLPELPPGGTLVAVTHGGTARATLATMLELPASSWSRLTGLDNCSWSVLVEHQVGWRLEQHGVRVPVVLPLADGGAL